MKKVLLMAALGAAGLMVAVPQESQAHRRDFVFSYDWKQPSKGEKEIESHTRYKRTDGSLQQAIELEYGISDRFAVAPYVVFSRDRGGSLRYHEWKLESRYQLGKYKTGKILPGVYLEYARERGEDGARGKSELEAKVILSHYNKKGDDITFNYTTERELTGGADWEHSYSLGYARDWGNRGNRIGGEWVHNLSEGTIKAGPTVGFGVGEQVWVVAGYGFGLNKREINKGEFRLLAEYEF